ncbi:MAG TPA: NUDIX domain-containing protein [Longimicrobiaceae bacterium]
MEDRSDTPASTGGTYADPTPATPLPASTLALLREGRKGREVLLLRRPAHSSFAPDVWVFPGGRVDPEDLELDHARHAAGPSPREWAAALSVDDPREAAGYVVAALRETWEETGILLSAGVLRSARGRVARREMLAGRSRLAAHLEALDVRLATGALRYIGHWVTPEWLPRRFDTRFFVATVHRRARCTLHGEELAEFRWVRPAEALEAASHGSLKLLPPTVHTLRSLDDS